MPETSTTAAINPQPPPTGTDGASRPRNRRRGGANNPQPDHGETPSTAGGPDSGSNAKGARRPRRPRAPAGATDGHSGEPSTTRPEGRGPPRGPPGGNRGRGGNRGGSVENGPPLDGGSTHSRPPRGPRRGGGGARPTNNAEAGIEAGRPPSAADGQSTRNKRPRRNHGRNFQGELTDGAGEGTRQDVRSSEKYRSNAPAKDDLTSRLTYDLSTPPYPDCLICFAPITPAQATWSCSPSHPIMVGSDDEHGAPGSAPRADSSAQCCWMTFHLKCLHAWAAKSVKDVVEAWRARGEVKEGDWRCPGCQSKRKAVPSSYWYATRICNLGDIF